MKAVRAAFSGLAAVPGHLWKSAVQPSLMALPQGTRRYNTLGLIIIIIIKIM